MEAKMLVLLSAFCYIQVTKGQDSLTNSFKDKNCDTNVIRENDRNLHVATCVCETKKVKKMRKTKLSKQSNFCFNFFLQPIQLSRNSEAFNLIDNSITAFEGYGFHTQRLIFESCDIKLIESNVFASLQVSQLKELQFRLSSIEIIQENAFQMPLKDVSVNFNNEFCATIFGAHPCKNVITLKPGIFTDSISTITLSYLTLTQFNTDVFVNMNENGNILIKNR